MKPVIPYIQSKKNKTSLAEKVSQGDLNRRGIDVLNPPTPLVAAKGDGVTDDTTAIQNILANTTGKIYFGDSSKTYLLSGTLTFDYTKQSLVGDGATLLFNNLGTGINVSANNSLPNNGFRNTGVIEGLFIQNTHGQTVSGSTGLLFGGSSSAGHNVSVRNCLIDGFYTGITFSNNAYLISFTDMAVQHANWCLTFPTGVTNSGENIRFTNCIFANATNGVSIAASQFRFTNCSFDYITNKYISCTTGGVAFLRGCHIEGNSDNDYWLYTNNAQSTIIVSGGTIAISGTNKSNYHVGQSNDSDGGIFLNDVFLILVNNNTIYGKQTLITGYGNAKNMLPYPVASSNRQGIDSANYLAQGGFESGNYNEWTNNGTINPSIDNTVAHSGTQSLKFASTSTKYTSVYYDLPCKPGDKVKFSGYFKANFNGSADAFYVIAQYFDALGNPFNPSTYTWTCTSASKPTSLNGVDPTVGWALYTVAPYVPAPSGAVKCRYMVRQCNAATTSDGLAVGWWDDILLTVD